MDLFCIEDSYLWVNLETFILKKENNLSPKTLIQCLSHFASQQEGSQDFYDYMEYNFHSEKFEKIDVTDLITIGYSFYQVHAGSHSFIDDFKIKLYDKLTDRLSTYDLLRVMQIFSEISK